MSDIQDTSFLYRVESYGPLDVIKMWLEYKISKSDLNQSNYESTSSVFNMTILPDNTIYTLWLVR